MPGLELPQLGEDLHSTVQESIRYFIWRVGMPRRRQRLLVQASLDDGPLRASLVPYARAVEDAL